MSRMTAAQTCRLTVIGPERRMDTFVPAGVALADLLPALLGLLGPELADHGLDHGGWVLQRLGEPPLDEDLTPLELGLYDGEVVHLRPRDDLLPPMDFDDLVDGVATGMRRRAGLWRPEFTQRATVIGTGLLLLAAPGLLAALAGPVPGTVLAWLAAALLLVHPFARSRGRNPRGLPNASALSAVLHAAVPVWLAPRFAAWVGLPTATWTLATLLALAGFVVAAVLAVFGRTRTVVIGLLSGAGWILTALLVAVASGGRAAVTEAIVLGLAVVMRTATPRLGFSLAGMRLDPLPTEPEDLQRRIDPEPGAALLAATARMDRVVTVLHAGSALAGSAMMLLLALGSGMPGGITAAAAAGAQLLATRPMTSTWQRLVVGLPALAVLLATLFLLARAAGPGGVVAGYVVLLGAAAWTATAGTAQAQRRISPVQGRIGDVVQFVAGASLLPLLLWVLGVYGMARGWVG